MSKHYTIELHCKPGFLRPCHILSEVLLETGVNIDPENTVSRFFGNWKWAVPTGSELQFEKARETIEGRIKSFYTLGMIRYGRIQSL